MNRILSYCAALIWAFVAYWLFAMHNLGHVIAAIPSILFGINPSVASEAREQVYGKEFSWFLLGSLTALGIAIYCVIVGTKRNRTHADESLQFTK